MKYPAGTIVQAHDRRYVVNRDGSWRVLDYQAAPVKEEGKEKVLEEQPLIPEPDKNEAPVPNAVEVG